MALVTVVDDQTVVFVCSVRTSPSLGVLEKGNNAVSSENATSQQLIRG